jgi:predicted TIM-barrel fold metal-dependent hydrolase
MSARDSAEIRAGLPHPVVDIDGHMIEYFPALAGFLREEGIDLSSPSMRRLVPGAFGPTVDWHALSTEERARRRVPRPPWWGSPASNTRDLATAMFPPLLHERLPDLGIDFSVVYPSIGLIYLHLEDERERRAACRALNRYNAEAFADLADRLCPVAAIPMVTPDEAVDELEHAVGELGFKAVVMNGFVQRPADAFADSHPELARWGMWVDTYGVDSAYDYDPVWQKCRELGVPASFHSGSMGWGSRMSHSNYMHNHIGQLNEGNHAVCKSLFLGGVTRRFPDVSFAFMEGGVAWAAMLFVDLLGHWEKRNVDALAALDPTGIDVALLGELRAKYGANLLELAASAATGSPTNMATRAPEDPSTLDEFAACEITRAEDIRDLFVPRFFFGCEADDPMTSTAFNTKVNPFGARLNAMFGSDIAHWDVPDMAEVLEEAWEMVEHELITETDFRDFVFTNPVALYTNGNPNFFDGTTVEAAARELASASVE